jgi:hypothetical protein
MTALQEIDYLWIVAPRSTGLQWHLLFAVDI